MRCASSHAFPDTNITEGTCQIQFHTSGESAYRKELIIINSKNIRDMAVQVIDNCVSEERSGGIITKNLANALLDLILISKM